MKGAKVRWNGRILIGKLLAIGILCGIDLYKINPSLAIKVNTLE